MKSEAVNILHKTDYLVLATINSDGSPWTTPLRFAYDSEKIYWVTSEVTIHSQNSALDDRVSITIFDSSQTAEIGTRGALYIQSHAILLVGEEELAARDIFADRFSDIDKLGSNVRLYAAVIGIFNEEKSAEQRLYFKSETAA